MPKREAHPLRRRSWVRGLDKEAARTRGPFFLPLPSRLGGAVSLPSVLGSGGLELVGPGPINLGRAEEASDLQGSQGGGGARGVPGGMLSSGPCGATIGLGVG